MKIQAFGAPKTPAQLYQDRKDRDSAVRSNKKHGIVKVIQWVREQDWKEAHPVIAVRPQIIHAARRTPARRRHGEGSRSSAASGDGNSDPEPDPERSPRSPLQLFDASSLADLFCISKKTIQNQYSRTPWLLPPAISIHGARGPRWTASAVQAWLENRPQHNATPAPQANARKVGRPRIALLSVGGAA
ncbi:hypothetical protein [Acidithiobacillus ferriphilus]|uniref:helix-turn-helix transcriptional regulator n=1 Tax=Acidithiobacillus ferriphilus TaxID=1689834 RepID=UPI002DB8E942|nr:hypothetical protein [Acidithiobacillus ferriphilus]MEB8476226.1 hypothetical protein [Acidithiobacillus ferriphilus]